MDIVMGLRWCLIVVFICILLIIDKDEHSYTWWSSMCLLEKINLEAGLMFYFNYMYFSLGNKNYIFWMLNIIRYIIDVLGYFFFLLLWWNNLTKATYNIRFHFSLQF